MKKLLLLCLALAAGCYPQAHVAVKNDCEGAYFRLSKLENVGDYSIVKERLAHGERVNVSLTGTAGQSNKFVIMADGFRESDNKPLGSATKDLWVFPTQGELTSPKNNESWQISWMYPGGCPVLHPNR